MALGSDIMGTFMVLSSSKWKSSREVFLESNFVTHCPGMKQMECPEPQETRKALGPCWGQSILLKIAWLQESQSSEALTHQGIALSQNVQSGPQNF